MDNEMINRYIYQVVKNLPSNSCKDIEEELRTLIFDMLEARTQGGEPSKDDINAVLTELGNPGELSNRYMESPRCLIGPSLFPKYIMVLKIVIFAFVIGMSIISVLEAAVSTDPHINLLARLLDNFFSGALSAVAWVTIIFAILERKGLDLGKPAERWKVSDLPPVPDENTSIKIGGPIASLIFLTLGAMLFIAAPQLFSAFITTKEGTLTIIPVFDLVVLKDLMPLFIGVFSMGAIKAIFSIIERRYTKKLVIISIVCDVLSIVFAVIIFSNSIIWNSNFAVDVNNALGLQSSQLQNIWGTFTSRLVLIIIAFGLIDPLTTLYKAIKYKI